VVVVVLPSEPVMPMIGHGQTALHLARDLRAAGLRFFEEARMHTRRAEDNVLVECVEIVLAEHKIHTEGREGRVAVAELGRFLFVMYGHAHAGGAQHADERHIAYACADDADALIRKTAKVLF